ncbi:MAG TPA: class I SAM-dependent methyltransferase, partial [Anaerolineales bacterium]|nr:class I SAM-dependent methyltransferase [Anaerolineales bacterium]
TDKTGDFSRLSFPRRIRFLLFRIFFQLLYHQFAWTYDTVAWIVSLGSWQKWIQLVVPYLDGPRVLEIGFGPGHLQEALHRAKIYTIGIDESRQMVQIARSRLVKSGFSSKLIRGEAHTLPFAAESFNQVVLTFPAEYILKSSTLSEIQRILVTGGKAVILPHAWITGRKPWERLMAWVNRITGEAPTWDPSVLEPLNQAGLDITWDMIKLSNSEILLIHLRKT